MTLPGASLYWILTSRVSESSSCLNSPKPRGSWNCSAWYWSGLKFRWIRDIGWHLEEFGKREASLHDPGLTFVSRCCPPSLAGDVRKRLGWELKTRLCLCAVQAGATGSGAEHVSGAGTQVKADSPQRTEEVGGVLHRCAKVRGLPFSCEWKLAAGNETCVTEF